MPTAAAHRLIGAYWMVEISGMPSSDMVFRICRCRASACGRSTRAPAACRQTVRCCGTASCAVRCGRRWRRSSRWARRAPGSPVRSALREQAAASAHFTLPSRITGTATAAYSRPVVRALDHVGNDGSPLGKHCGPQCGMVCPGGWPSGSRVLMSCCPSASDQHEIPPGFGGGPAQPLFELGDVVGVEQDRIAQRQDRGLCGQELGIDAARDSPGAFDQRPFRAQSLVVGKPLQQDSRKRPRPAGCRRWRSEKGWSETKGPEFAMRASGVGFRFGIRLFPDDIKPSGL